MCLPISKSLRSAMVILEKLRKGLSMLRTSKNDNVEYFDDDWEEVSMIPKDVKEGHFAVVAGKGGRSKRFVLELGYLSNPAFLRLLDEAKEEYGFEHKGPLAIPCQPEEVQKILEFR